jgi:hypothetical protein
MRYIHEKSNVYVCDDGVLAPIDNRLDSTIYLTEKVEEAKLFPGKHNFIGFCDDIDKIQYIYLEKVNPDGTADFRPTQGRALVFKFKEHKLCLTF